MIHVKAKLHDGRYVLDMEGHADYNPGNDIVCAGASAVVGALAGWLANSWDKLEEKPEISMEHGRAHIEARGGFAAYEAFRQALCGLCSIQESYPENISVDASDC